MSSKQNNGWILIIFIVIILVVINWHYYKSEDWQNKQNQISERIDKLQKEKEILNNHIKKNLDLNDKINKQSQRLWRILVRILVFLFVLSNGFYLLVFKAFSFESILTIYSIIIGILNILYLVFFFKFFSIKLFIFNDLKEYSYKIIAGRRDAEYYETRNESIQDRIEQIELEIRQLTSK